MLGAAALALCALILWTALWALLVFGTLRRLGQLRVTPEAELVGMDLGQHGGSAYSDDFADSPEPEYPPPYVQPELRTSSLPTRSIEITAPSTLPPTAAPASADARVDIAVADAPRATTAVEVR